MDEKTYVPGLNRKNSQPFFENMQEGMSTPISQQNCKEDQDIPVVGFLYSLSRSGEPEWWPLHIGQNKIGTSDNMDICLAEGTISSHHANINLKRLRRSGNALAASLVDVGSKTGILLNDEELDYEPRTLKNEDVVTFGLNYKCVVILIDPTKYGLEENADFVATDTVNSKAKLENTANEDPFSGLDSTVSKDPFGNYDPNATVGIAGGASIDISGGSTKIL